MSLPELHARGPVRCDDATLYNSSTRYYFSSILGSCFKVDCWLAGPQVTHPCGRTRSQSILTKRNKAGRAMSLKWFLSCVKSCFPSLRIGCLLRPHELMAF